MTTHSPDEHNNSQGMVRERFDGTEIVRVPETASTAIAAAAKAAIEARYILALRRPRDMDKVRTLLMKDCERPGFAESAIYRKPVGKKQNAETGEWEQQYIEGLSVRFSEAALRYMTNIYQSASSIFDDETKGIVRVSLMDLESNSTVEMDVTVTKTVERKSLKKNQRPVSSRTNSYGDTVFIVEATDDEVLNKTNALISKARRNAMLQLVPGDILSDCESKCRETMKNQDAKDPAAAKKKIFDVFAGIGVMPDQLKSYLGIESDAPLQPAQLRELRGIFSAIQEGETTWNAIVEAKQPVGEGEKKTAAAKKVEELLKTHTQKANTPTKKEGAKQDDKKADSGDPAADKSGNPEPGANG
jgi:hypothetical protein